MFDPFKCAPQALTPCEVSGFALCAAKNNARRNSDFTSQFFHCCDITRSRQAMLILTWNEHV